MNNNAPYGPDFASYASNFKIEVDGQPYAN